MIQIYILTLFVWISIETISHPNINFALTFGIMLLPEKHRKWFSSTHTLDLVHHYSSNGCKWLTWKMRRPSALIVKWRFMELEWVLDAEGGEEIWERGDVGESEREWEKRREGERKGGRKRESARERKIERRGRGERALYRRRETDRQGKGIIVHMNW